VIHLLFGNAILRWRSAAMENIFMSNAGHAMHRFVIVGLKMKKYID